MLPTIYNICVHPRLTPDASTYALIDPDHPGQFIYAVHVRVFCPDCEARFRFLGNNALAPATAKQAQEDRRGAWVSGAADELACMIAPMEPGDSLSDMEVQGTA